MRSKIFATGLLIGAAALLSGCQNRQGQAGTPEYPVLSISTADKVLNSSYSAIVRGRQDINIYAQVSGKITQVNVKEGEAVKKGQVLFVIDQVPYIAALRAAEANLESAKVGVESAQLDYDNTKALFEHQVVSEYELKSALNALHSAKATLAQMEALEIDARNNLSYTEVSSPADGVVGTLPLREGSLVSANSTEPLTTVSDNTSMYVYFSFNENKILELGRQYGNLSNAIANMPDIQLQLSDGSLYDHSGRVESISGLINENTGTVSVRAVFPNPDRLLLSGANGSVLIPQTYKDIILIPQEATYELQDKIFVYKVDDGRTRNTQIKVSDMSDGKEYIVTEGLKAGDVIVASGAGLLRDGMEIRIAETQHFQKDSIILILSTFASSNSTKSDILITKHTITYPSDTYKITIRKDKPEKKHHEIMPENKRRSIQSETFRRLS